MATTWTLQWKRGAVDVSLPEANVAAVAGRPELPTLGSPRELVARALERPLGCPPLEAMVRPGDRVALLVTDVHDSLFGPEGGIGATLLDLLNGCGIPDRDITVVHATGMHGHYGARQKLGEEILGRAGYVEHDPLHDDGLAFLGATRHGTAVWVNRAVAEADLVMGLGGCGPSLFGFQGGGGIILPGVSGRDTIRHNHSLLMSVRSGPGWWPGFPMREDVLDAADLARLRLKIDLTANTAFAGYPREEWPTAVDYVKRHVMTPVEPADLYVFAPGRSAELPTALYMSIEFAEQATKPNGIVIAAASAADHTPLRRRPLDEVLFETIYITEQWCQETGEADGTRAYWAKRDQICKEELLCLSLEELSRVVARRRGEPRTTIMAWSHRRCLERRRTFLVTEGVTPEEGALMGFAYTTDSFEQALAKAFDELGRDARVVANMPPNNGFPLVMR